MRIIDADELLQKMQTEYDSTDRLIDQGELHLDTLAEGYTEVHILIESLPTIDPDSLIPHGRWIEGKEIEGGTEIPIGVCSICGDSYNLEEFPFATLCDYFIYCPNCGAKMDKEDENGTVL